MIPVAVSHSGFSRGFFSFFSSPGAVSSSSAGGW